MLTIVAECEAQSTCTFLKNVSYLTGEWIPMEPMEVELKHCSLSQQHTCCTRKVEAEMERQSMAQLELEVRNHIRLLRAFLNRSEQLFYDHLRAAIADTNRNLNDIYTHTYGSFYTSQPPNSADSPTQIFSDFFAALRCHFVGTQRADNVALNSVFNEMFDRVYVMEFILMNPLTTSTDDQLKCMLGLQAKLRPFGSIPDKMKLLVTKGLNAWAGFLSALRRISHQLENIEQNFTLERDCMGELTRMSQCHLCAGEAEEMRPCLHYCLGVLKGCLGSIANIDRTFNRLIEALIRVSSRMKTAHNPYNVLLPLPFQISEAIMHFQELGIAYSNRILLHCFQAEFQLWTKRQSRSFLKRRKRMAEDYATKVVVNSSGMKAVVWEFIDKLARLKGFWQAIPRQLCYERGIATAEWGNCWNGESVGPYVARPSKGRVSNGLRFDFESSSAEDDRYHVEARREFASIAGSLKALYEGANYSVLNTSVTDATNDASEMHNTLQWTDDEDYTDEGSGDDEEGDDRDDYDDDYYQRIAPYQLRILPASGAFASSAVIPPMIFYIVSAAVIHPLLI